MGEMSNVVLRAVLLRERTEVDVAVLRARDPAALLDVGELLVHGLQAPRTRAARHLVTLRLHLLADRLVRIGAVIEGLARDGRRPARRIDDDARAAEEEAQRAVQVVGRDARGVGRLGIDDDGTDGTDGTDQTTADAWLRGDERGRVFSDVAVRRVVGRRRARAEERDEEEERSLRERLHGGRAPSNRRLAQVPWARERRLLSGRARTSPACARAARSRESIRLVVVST